jgi:hypothetical protein
MAKKNETDMAEMTTIEICVSVSPARCAAAHARPPYADSRGSGPK